MDADLDWGRDFTCTGQMLKRLDPPAARAIGHLRGTLSAYLNDDGVFFQLPRLARHRSSLLR